MNEQQNNRNPPVKTIRLGPVEASIWENQGTDGRPNHSVTFRRSYRDGNQWRDSDTYWSDHLPLLAKAADLAHTAILTELRQSPGKEPESACPDVHASTAQPSTASSSAPSTTKQGDRTSR